MRAFLIFVAFVSLAQADNFGYNYDNHNINSGTNYAPLQNVIVQKEFYTYSASDNEYDDVPIIGEQTQSRKRHLRVIFIRAPENNGLTDAIANLVRDRAESKTAIYVLTKQTDIGSLAQQLQNISNQNHYKPEVRFVKYRTEEDALNAQRIIQQQYETLGGKTQVHNGAVAPVLNFASNVAVQQSGSFNSQSSGHSYIPANIYLPNV